VAASLAVLLVLGLFPRTANAGFGMTIDYGNVAGFEDLFPGAHTWGWTFSTNNAISVTDLGVYSGGDDGDGLFRTHIMGIFNSSGTLLGSTTIGITPNGPGAINMFRYAALGAPIILAPGETYTIAATFPGSPPEQIFFADPAPQAGLSIDPAINYIGWVERNFATTLQFPNQGPFGPEEGYRFSTNMQFTVIPAPGAPALIAVVGLAGGSRRRRV